MFFSRSIKMFFILSLLVMVFVFSLCANKKGVAAVVNGERIMIDEVETMIQRYAAVNRKLDSSYQLEPKGLVLENMRKQFLDGLIDKKILLKKARELSITISDSEFTEKVALLRKSNGIVPESTFNDYLKEMGLKKEEFENNIREILLLEKTSQKYFVSIAVTSDEALLFYNENGSRFAKEKMEAAHIFLKWPKTGLGKGESDSVQIIKKAEKILTEIASPGSSFELIAKKYSEDAAASNGGKIGFFAKGDMLRAFDSAAFMLKKGEISGIVQSEHGVHIIKALSSPKKELVPFDDVKSIIIDEITLERRGNSLKALRDSSKIVVKWDFKTI